MKKFLAVLLLSLCFHTANAGTQAGNLNAEFDLNKASPGAMAKHLLGSLVIHKELRVIQLSYDYSQQGGSSAATVSLWDEFGKPAKLPKGAIIRDCIIDVITALQSSTGTGATVAVGTGAAANDLKTAALASSYTGLMACIPVGTAATSIKLSADQAPYLTISSNNVVAGKLNVFVEYLFGI